MANPSSRPTRYSLSSVHLHEAPRALSAVHGALFHGNNQLIHPQLEGPVCDRVLGEAGANQQSAQLRLRIVVLVVTYLGGIDDMEAEREQLEEPLRPR